MARRPLFSTSSSLFSANRGVGVLGSNESKADLLRDECSGVLRHNTCVSDLRDLATATLLLRQNGAPRSLFSESSGLFLGKTERDHPSQCRANHAGTPWRTFSR